MNNTKESIEEQIKSLQDKLQEIFESEKKKRNIRYISSNIEGGEFPIENDTFNIICKTIGNGSIPLYEYEVTNLSQALRESIHDINQNIHRFRLVSKNGPETVRNSYDICFNVGNVNINSSSVLTEENKIKWNRIKNILETKDWQISDDTRTYGGIFKRYFNYYNSRRMSNKDVWDGIPVITPHYTFELEYKSKIHQKGVYDKGHLYVGNEEDPCLSITFQLPGVYAINDRFASMDISVAHLNKIKNMKECILEKKEGTKSSFAEEMLDGVMVEIRKSFKHLHHIKLQDSSYIPCDGEKETLDLLFYNIALYKKSWYEEKFHAYFTPRDTFIQYRCAIEKYASSKTKSSISWVEFYTNVIGSANYFTHQVLQNDMERYESMYNSVNTFPDFFIAISKTMDKKDKCKFFKDWLEAFLQGTMNIPNKRIWYIDLYTVEKKEMRGGFRKFRNTRKRKPVP